MGNQNQTKHQPNPQTKMNSLSTKIALVAAIAFGAAKAGNICNRDPYDGESFYAAKCFLKNADGNAGVLRLFQEESLANELQLTSIRGNMQGLGDRSSYTIAMLDNEPSFGDSLTANTEIASFQSGRNGRVRINNLLTSRIDLEEIDDLCQNKYIGVYDIGNNGALVARCTLTTTFCDKDDDDERR